MRARWIMVIFAFFLLAGCGVPAAALPVPAATPTVPPSRGPALETLHMADAQLGWAVTRNGGRLLHTSDGTSSWQDGTPPAGAVTAAASFFLDGQRAFVQGSGGTLFTTRDGGRTWASFTLPFAGASLRFQDDQTGWAVTVLPSSDSATQTAQVYQTANGGGDWSMLSLKDPRGSPPGAPGGSLQLKNGAQLEVQNAENLWLSSGRVTTSSDFTLYASWDGGQTWQAQQIPVPVEEEMPPTEISVGLPVFLSAREAYFTASFVLTAEDGGNARSVLALYTSEDGGRSWKTHPLVQAAGPTVSVDMISLTRGFVPCGEMLCRTQDGGETWQAVASDLRFRTDQGLALLGVDFVDTQRGWALTPGGLYQTSDGGLTWQPDPVIVSPADRLSGTPQGAQ